MPNLLVWKLKYISYKYTNQSLPSRYWAPCWCQLVIISIQGRFGVLSMDTGPTPTRTVCWYRIGLVWCTPCHLVRYHMANIDGWYKSILLIRVVKSANSFKAACVYSKNSAQHQRKQAKHWELIIITLFLHLLLNIKEVCLEEDIDLLGLHIMPRFFSYAGAMINILMAPLILVISGRRLWDMKC